MSYSLTAVLRLKDDFSNKLNRAISNVSTMRRSVTATSVAVLGLSSALSSTSAVGVAAVGALSASFAAAGIGATAYGVVAASALTKVFEAAEEVEKINEKIANADTAKERIKAQKELVALYDDMSAEQQGALKTLQRFQTYWDDFVAGFEKPVFQAFATSLQITMGVLEKLRPTIENVSGVVNELLTQFNQRLESGSLNKFFEWLSTNAAESLYNFARTSGNVMEGFFELMRAFAPLGASMEEGMLRLSERFKEWAASLEGSKGFQDFVNYARENGPVLVSILGNVWQIITDLVAGLMPLGSVVLKATDAITGFLAESDILDDVIVGVVAALVTYKAAMAGMAIVGVITKMMASYKAVAGTMTVAQWALNAAMTANPVGLVITAIAALVGLLVVAYRKSETFRNAVHGLWSGIKKLGSLLKDHFIKEFQRLKDLISTISEKFSAFKDMTAKFTIPNALKKAGELLAKVKGGGGSSEKADGSHYHGLDYVPRNNYVANLHKGERVLTAKENREYSKGGGNSVNLTVHYNGGQKLDQAEMNRFANYLAKQLYKAGEAGA